MYKIVKRGRAIQCVVILAALFIILSIYPVRMWTETIPSVSNQMLAGSSDSVGEDYMLQRFIAQYDHLGNINLYLADFENGWDKDARVDRFLFRMLDSNMEVMFEEEVDVRFVNMPGFCTVYVNEDLEVGKDYYFFLQGIKGSRAWFGLEETANAGTPYVSRLIYNYDELPGYNVMGEYNYSVPLRKGKVLAYDLIILAAAAVLVGAIGFYHRKSSRDKLITVQRAFCFTANILIVLGTLAGVYMTAIQRFFSGQLLDNIFYTGGILLCSGLLFYAVNRKRDRTIYVALKDRMKEHWTDYLQSAFIAGAVLACCNYMNGLYELQHRLAERQLMIFFALAVLTMFKKKQILHKASLVYVVLAVAAGIRYYSIYVDVLSMNEMEIRAIRYGIYAVLLGGFILLQLILCLLKRKQMSKISTWYGLALGTFFVLLIVFRNTRWWTVALVAAFTLFYLSYAFWDKKEHLLQNICNGLVLNFICCVVFSLIRRPFLSWVYPRFPFIFHTVTVTAVYMTVIMCAAAILLADKLQRKAHSAIDYESAKAGMGSQFVKSYRFGYIFKELVVFGVAGTYMIFTASRTGFLSVAVLVVLVIVLTAAGTGMDRLKNMAGLAGLMAAAVLCCFPAVFTAQRILPAVSNDVFRYDIEEFPDAVARGNEWDSMYYITVRRFAEVFNNKIFGIEESGSASYERSDEYQKYRARRFNSKGEVVWEGSAEEADQPQETGTDTGTGQEDSTVQKQSLEIIGTKTEEERAAEDEQAALREESAKNNDVAEEEPEQAPAEEDFSVYEKTEEYANGRMDIFRAYISQLNMTGHDDMGAPLPDGTQAVHAHNIYLQTAYDHGIIVGVVFIIIGVASFVQGCIFYVRRRKDVPCAALPAVFVAAFAVAGFVEWIFHLCHPAGFTLLLVLAPLLFEMGGKKDQANEKR